MEWSEEIIARLRGLWSEGLSTAEIGRRMGISKNAVVGKAHRLNLPPRPSPIRRDSAAEGEMTPRAAAPRRTVGPTLPPLAAAPSQAAVAVAPAAMEPAARPVVPAPRPVAVRPAPVRHSRLASCCWPIGEPGTKSFHFCDAEALTGKPYCAAHAQLAYVKVRDRRDEAAA
jgi:GcrA cell cycle regulator